MTKIHQTLFCDAIPQGLLGRFNLVNDTPSNLIKVERQIIRDKISKMLTIVREMGATEWSGTPISVSVRQIRWEVLCSLW